MNTLIHADIFFFVTTICVAVLTILLIIAWVYVIRILASVRSLTEKARIEGEFVIEEVGRLRRKIETERFGMRAIYRFIRRIIGRY